MIYTTKLTISLKASRNNSEDILVCMVDFNAVMNKHRLCGQFFVLIASGNVYLSI